MRLKLRTQKIALSLATGGCVAGALLTAAWGVSPLAAYRVVEREKAHETSAAKSEANLDLLPDRAAFAELVDIPLRRPLYDPPPPTPEVKQLPPLQVELLGTIIEPDNSMAMIRSAQGTVEYKRVGDSVGPADGPASIVEIHGDSVILERGEERVTLSAGGQGFQ